MTTPGSIVFLLGSVFGGTGASSIPILPHALQEAAKIVSKDGQGDLLSKNLFGTCLLYTSPSPRDATLSRMPSSA